MHRASLRSGSAATKTRGFVRGGGKKPWKQKGTGRARAGSTRSPLWVGGGTIFGPTPRNYGYRLPKSARREGLRSALRWKAERGRLVVIEDFDLPDIKTKHMVSLMKSLAIQEGLLLLPEANSRIEKSARNLSGLRVLHASDMSVYDLLRTGTLILTRKALGLIEQRLED
jgi:large subunit ribosomal protein L4